MKVRDLDNRIVNWTPAGTVGQNKSSLHINARSLLRTIYPTAQILEEVTVPLRRGQVVYMDFYLPLYKLCIEVHGEQHFKFIPHFHGTPQGFAQSKRRDRFKREWCELNNIRVIELSFNETLEEWENKLLTM